MEILKVVYPQPISALLALGYSVEKIEVDAIGLLAVWLRSGDGRRLLPHQELVPGLEIRLVRDGLGGVEYGNC